MRLGQDENDREKDHGKAGQRHQHLAEQCLQCVHRRRPLELESDTGRGRPRLLAAGSRVAGPRSGGMGATSSLQRNAQYASCNLWSPD
jgi:hypothetical protein